jgi:hypothetical protein
MDVSYFTCLDDIANAIDDLIAHDDIYVSATGDSDKPTVEPVALKPSVDGIYDNNKRQVNAFGETSGTIPSSSFPSLSLRPRLNDAKAVLPGLIRPKSKRRSSKWLWSLLKRALRQGAEVVRDSAHLQLPPSRQLSPPHERLRALACSFFSGKKELRSCIASSSAPEPSRSASPSAKMCFQEPFVAREHEMCSHLVPRKGNQEYGTASARLVLQHQAAGRPHWPGGNSLSTLSPRKWFATSSRESKWSSKRVCPFRRNLRRRSLSTRKTSILQFKICSRADELGCIKT